MAIATPRAREGRYDPKFLDTFAATRGAMGGSQKVREIPLSDLAPGMVLVEDLYLNGTTGDCALGLGAV